MDATPNYRKRVERVEVAQRIAGHWNGKRTGLYDRRNDDVGVGVGEVETIRDQKRRFTKAV